MFCFLQAHEFGHPDFDNYNSTGMFGYSLQGWLTYGKTKLSNLYFTYELHRRMRLAGIEDVDVNAVHPVSLFLAFFGNIFWQFFCNFWQFLAMVCMGNWTDGVFCAQGIVDTELPRSLSLNFYPLLRSTGGLITPAQGARGQIDACIGDEWEGISGKYVAEQSGPGGSEVGPGGKKGVFKVTESSKYSYDQEAAARLWKVSKALTGASWEALGEGKVEKESMAVSSWM